MNPKAKQIVDHLLEGTEEGAHLSVDELNKVYLNDYEGDTGLKKAIYLGPSDSGDHVYLALTQDPMPMDDDAEWFVSRIYIKKGSPSAGPEALSMDFEGQALFTSASQEEAEAFFDKESHVKGGGKIVKKPAIQPPPYMSGTRARHSDSPTGSVFGRALSGNYRGRGSSSSSDPHWDGNRYAL